MYTHRKVAASEHRTRHLAITSSMRYHYIRSCLVIFWNRTPNNRQKETKTPPWGGSFAGASFAADGEGSRGDDEYVVVYSDCCLLICIVSH